MSAAHRYPGLPVVLGGQSMELPPLSAAAAKRYWSRIEAMQRGQDPDPLGLIAALVACCLQRNDPSISVDQVAEWVDMDNMEELGAKVMGAGSFRRWVEMQAAAASAAGNAVAPMPSPVAGTGAPSTLPLPPAPDGAGATSTP